MRGKVFDLFMATPGRIVSYTELRRLTGNVRGPIPIIVARLQDDYGLDIRNISPTNYCLAGRWVGKKYHDFVAADQKANGLR